MLPQLTIPIPEAPAPLPDYGLPDKPQLDWSFVAGRMTAARNYWICTAAPDGQPHAVPVWGTWHGDRFYFDGSPDTRWHRNLAANPAIAVHLPDPESVVFIEGQVQVLHDHELAEETRDELAAIYRAKYDMDGRPHYVVEPRLVMAWDAMNLGTMTRWRFD